MTTDTTTDRLATLRAQLAALQAEIAEAERQEALDLAPFKPGDVIRTNRDEEWRVVEARADRVYGYSYRCTSLTGETGKSIFGWCDPTLVTRAAEAAPAQTEGGS